MPDSQSAEATYGRQNNCFVKIKSTVTKVTVLLILAES